MSMMMMMMTTMVMIIQCNNNTNANVCDVLIRDGHGLGLPTGWVGSESGPIFVPKTDARNEHNYLVATGQ